MVRVVVVAVLVLVVVVAPATPVNATFAGDNGVIAYVGVAGTGADAHGEVRLVNPDGSRPRALVAGGQPAWDPGGKRLAFVRYVADVPQLFVMRADGSRVRQVTRFAHGAEQPAWSPNGRELVFARYRDIRNQPLVTSIWRMRLDRSGLRQVVPAFEAGGRQTYAWDPSWGPTGRIAYSANAATNFNPDMAIFTVRPDGTGRRRLTPAQSAYEPDWSPNGKLLVYKRYHGSDPTTLDVMRADGTGRRTVVSRRAGVGDPTWSPDGRRIAYVSLGGSGDEPGLYTVRRDGTARRLVRAGEVYSAAWQPRP